MDLLGYEGVDSPKQEMEKIVFAMRLSSRLKMDQFGYEGVASLEYELKGDNFGYEAVESFEYKLDGDFLDYEEVE